MLITFTSSAAAEILMYKTHAQPILELLEKNVEQGVITAEEMPAAISRLEQAIAGSKQSPPPAQSGSSYDQDQNDEDIDTGKNISFATRAFPLLEMMRAARDEGTFVMWGV